MARASSTSLSPASGGGAQTSGGEAVGRSWSQSRTIPERRCSPNRRRSRGSIVSRRSASQCTHSGGPACFRRSAPSTGAVGRSAAGLRAPQSAAGEPWIAAAMPVRTQGSPSRIRCRRDTSPRRKSSRVSRRPTAGRRLLLAGLDARGEGLAALLAARKVLRSPCWRCTAASDRAAAGVRALIARRITRDARARARGPPPASPPAADSRHRRRRRGQLGSSPLAVPELRQEVRRIDEQARARARRRRGDRRRDSGSPHSAHRSTRQGPGTPARPAAATARRKRTDSSQPVRLEPDSSLPPGPSAPAMARSVRWTVARSGNDQRRRSHRGRPPPARPAPPLPRTIDRDIWAMAWPAMLSLIVVNLVDIVDVALVGRLGATDRRGVGLRDPVRQPRRDAHPGGRHRLRRSGRPCHRGARDPARGRRALAASMFVTEGVAVAGSSPRALSPRGRSSGGSTRPPTSSRSPCRTSGSSPARCCSTRRRSCSRAACAPTRTLAARCSSRSPS